jgi:hypothetical protein
VVLGRAVHLDRDVDQSEGDRALPDGTHRASMPTLLCGYAANGDGPPRPARPGPAGQHPLGRR